MQGTAIFIGATVFVSLAGAVTGELMVGEPIMKRGEGDGLPQVIAAIDPHSPFSQTEQLPDHYPLVTPNGTIEVYQLSRINRMWNKAESGWWDTPSSRSISYSPSYHYENTERYDLSERELMYDRATKPAEHAQSAPVPAQRAISRAEAPMVLAEMPDQTQPAKAKSPNVQPKAPGTGMAEHGADEE